MESPKPFDEALIQALASTVLDDEFGDAAQNENLYQQHVAVVPFRDGQGGTH